MRFNLRFHRETNEVDAYVLSPDKNGCKNLREHPPTNVSDIAIDQKVEQKRERVFHEEWTAKSSPIEFFVWRLGSRLGRPIVDETGLRAAGYDFNLSFTNLPPPVVTAGAPDPQSDSSEPDIFDALRDQLGLRLDRRKAPVEVLVIDHVERPSEN